MRRKQLFAIILAGALAAGSAPAAVFAAESDMAAMSEEGVTGKMRELFLQFPKKQEAKTEAVMQKHL